MPSRLLTGLHNIVLSFWVGGMWTAGYLVAPTLFSLLDDRRLAGTLAGHVFMLLGWFGLGASILLSLYYAFALHSRWRVVVTALMGVLVAVNLFIVTPELVAIRDHAVAALEPGSNAYRHFGYLHGISSGIFLLVSLLGLLLVARMAEARQGGLAASATR